MQTNRTVQEIQRRGGNVCVNYVPTYRLQEWKLHKSSASRVTKFSTVFIYVYMQRRYICIRYMYVYIRGEKYIYIYIYLTQSSDISRFRLSQK